MEVAVSAKLSSCGADPETASFFRDLALGTPVDTMESA